MSLITRRSFPTNLSQALLASKPSSYSKTTSARRVCLLHGNSTACSRNSYYLGKTVNHQFAKELLVGFAGGEVDKLAETHGMNEYDKFEAHRHAKKKAEELYGEKPIFNGFCTGVDMKQTKVNMLIRSTTTRTNSKVASSS